jgi:hypothetical protein
MMRRTKRPRIGIDAERGKDITFATPTVAAGRKSTGTLPLDSDTTEWHRQLSSV